MISTLFAYPGMLS